MLSRRHFIEQLSAASALVGSKGVRAISLGSLGIVDQNAESQGLSPDAWKSYGRIVLQFLSDSVIVRDGFAMEAKTWEDCVYSFEARAPQDVAQVQIWAGIKCRDRDNRYVFALRGGDNDDMYVARYGSEGASKFLGIAPLGFHPEPGTWYRIKAVSRGGRLLIYLNQEELPRLNVVDDEAPWREGSVSIGSGWLPAEFRNIGVRTLTAQEEHAIYVAGDAVWQPPMPDKMHVRAEQRARYQPLRIADCSEPRSEHSLDGSWLFLPDQEVSLNAAPQSEILDDSQWHVIGVPDFWTPTLTWLHAETGFPELHGISSSKGISDRLWEAELKRLDSYTFDWRKTSSAWYRQYIDLPADLKERRFEICFDAIAKVSEIWVNGVKVGSHVGMFGEVRCEITPAVHPGRNVVAVHVLGRLKTEASNQVVGVAVTVAVTDSMLKSLPHGMYPEEAGGIWQPAKLRVTQLTWIEDIYAKPRLDGLDLEVSVRAHAVRPRNVSVAYAIRSCDSRETLFEAPAGESKPVSSGDEIFHLSTPKLAPRLWSPADPVLYLLEVTLWSEGNLLDRQSMQFGFRTFSAHHGRLYLNGQPYWLRGANHFPHALRPNDAALARRFMQLARDGNVAATRSHTAPFSETWLRAADEIGMTVSFEGTWPWLMLTGEPPSQELLQHWSSEFLSLIRKHRNHPSIVLWTVNNEMKFEMLDKKRPDLLERKWRILSATVKSIRATDSTRPIVCDSSYCRKEIGPEYEDLVRPNDFDDGDIDDAHRYPGWYNPSFFHYFQGEFGRELSYSGRPLISQEMSTGYPRNDDGHPCRFYLFKHYTPQSLVGDEAYENRDPAIFLKRQSFITKELAEAIRRTNREQCSGILHFAYVSWFKGAWNAESIAPLETYDGLKLALQPVLASAELYGRHLYAGTSRKIRVCIANDTDGMRSLPQTELQWRIAGGEEELARGVVSVDPVPYYSNQWAELTVALPTIALPRRIDARLSLRLQSGQSLLSDNHYDLVVAAPSWAWHGDWSHAAVLHSAGHVPANFQHQGVRPVSSLLDLKPGDVAVLADAGQSLANPAVADALRSYVMRGGSALLFNGGPQLARLFPEQIKSYQTGTGEIVSMRVPESPVFDGLDPLDLAWWGLGPGELPRVCRGAHQFASGAPNLSVLAEAIHTHGYLQQPSDFLRISGSPLFELRMGSGRMIVCELMLLDAAPFDPVAGRLLSNLMVELAGESCHCRG